MTQHTIAILGGSGFVGRHLCAALAKAGHQVRVFTRRPEACKQLTVLPTVSVLDVDVYDSKELTLASKDCDVMINLIGILNEKGHDGDGFELAHVGATQMAIRACELNHIPRYIHMSALNADAKHATSHYLRTKGIAEDYAHTHQQTLHVTSFRPSVIFGPGDSFFNRFAKLIKYAPGFMFLPSDYSQMAPIYIGDLVTAMVKSIDMRETYGKRYDLCGPMVYTLKSLVQFTAKTIDEPCYIIGLNPTWSNIAAHILEYMPFKVFSVDNYHTALTPSVCKTPFPALFDIRLSKVEYIVPTYLGVLSDDMNQIRRRSERERA